MNKILLFLGIICLYLNVANGSSGDPENIPWKDIHFCRFWQWEKIELVEKILIINEKKEPVIISLMIAHSIESSGKLFKVVTDSSFGIVGGPLKISAKGYLIANMPRLGLIGELGYYYKIICSTSEKTWLMHIYNSKPICKFSNDKIITTLGGDNVGNTRGASWWETDKPFILSGEKVRVSFKFIPKLLDPKSLYNEFYIRVKDPTDTVTNRSVIPLKLVNIESGNLQVESEIQAPDKPYKWRSLTVKFPPTSDSSRCQDNYSVDFILEAPKVESPEYHYFGSFVLDKDYGSTFHLPLIVLPK
jgi:hypothetical protein